MSTSFHDQLKKDLERDEGRVRLPYEDTVGKISIGVGHNLSDNGLPDHFIDLLLDYDIQVVEADLDRLIPWWRERPEKVKLFLANLCFNLGLDKFRKFRETLKLIEAKQYKAAARQFRSNKRYFQQVGERANRLAKLLETV